MQKALLTVIAISFRVMLFAQPGAVDMTFDPGTGCNGFIHDVVIQSDGKIVVGGDFTTFNRVAAGNIARLNTNGSLDTTFRTGAGMNASVGSLLLQPDGKIIVAGDFTLYHYCPTKIQR